ncbi:MAG: hypothetical protein Q8K65_09710 [Alphaproteobacteria bacterium]|nr:hypothetical protein [Alphaproteobacteria bacterium]
MSWLKKIFGQAARKSYFPPPIADGPPQPEGYWSMIVDENGEAVTNRPPTATDFLARRPIDYIDGGTQPAFKKDPLLNERENTKNLVDYEIRSQKNKEHLQKAVFLLSQTDDGARLLSKAKQMEFRLVFNDDLCKERNASGLCDYANKQIPLASGSSAANVALTLKHELQHMEDIKNGMRYGLSDTPRSAILLDRVLEGNARVSEAVAAAEALLGSPQGPARQFRTAALFNEFWRACPQMAQEAQSALPQAAENKWTTFAAKVLPAYFRETATLALYERDYFKFIDKYVPDTSNSIKAAKDGDYQHRAAHQRYVDSARNNANTLFTQDRWNAENIAPLLTIRGIPYMKEITGKGFSLASETATALTATGPALFEKLKQNIRTVLPESDKPALLDLPVQKSALALPALPNPYTGYTSKLETEAFAAIQMPHRLDGSRLSNGQRSHESTTQLFNDAFKAMKSGATDTDRIHYVINSYLHQNAGVANVRGLVGNLLEAGLRAPIGAFPEKYLVDLRARATLSVRLFKEGQASDISPKEAKLLDHWQQMKDKGMDPVWIDAANKQASWVAKDGRSDFYEKEVLGYLKDKPVAEKAAIPAQKRQ